MEGKGGEVEGKGGEVEVCEVRRRYIQYASEKCWRHTLRYGRTTLRVCWSVLR